MTSNDPTVRIIELEMAVSHLEHKLEQMHSVLLAIQADLTTSRDTISRLERRIQLATEPAEDHQPALERPPHY